MKTLTPEKQKCFYSACGGTKSLKLNPQRAQTPTGALPLDPQTHGRIQTGAQGARAPSKPNGWQKWSDRVGFVIALPVIF